MGGKKSRKLNRKHTNIDVNQNGVVTKSTSANSIHSATPNNNNINNLKTKAISRAGKPSPRPAATRNSRDLAPIFKRQLHERDRAIDAFAALLNYCTQDLDAFQTPCLKQQLEKKKNRVQELETELTNVRETCRKLETSLSTTENLAEQLRTEEANLRVNLTAEQYKVETLQSELDFTKTTCLRLQEEVAESKTKLKSGEIEFLTQNQALADLSYRFDKVLDLKRESDDSLRECRERSEALSESLREKESEVNVLNVENNKLSEKVALLSVENEKLKELQQEVERLRLCNSNEGAVKAEKNWDNGGLCVNQRLSKVKGSCVLNGASDNTLLSEVESLRQVLALKTEEVIELRRLQLHHKIEAERVPQLLSSITTLEAKVEDLQSQLSSQQEAARNLAQEKEKLHVELKRETDQRTRLSLKNEELVYTLQLKASAMWQLAERTVETSTPISTSPRKVEPNSRPEMVGVVQKSDSVSYILNMGENTDEMVSSIVKRAENARCQTLPKKKRARTLPSIDTPGSEYFTCPESPIDSPITTPRRPTRTRACVRLSHEDFTNDSIDVPRGADCDVIEIMGSFDRHEPDMSSSTTSNSSSNFDIESEAYPECNMMIRFPRDTELLDEPLEEEDEEEMDGEEEEEDEIEIPPSIATEHEEVLAEVDDTELTFLKTCAETPELLAGEAMVAGEPLPLSDDDDIK